MTIVESIKCVLQQNNDGLTSKQIYDEIIRQGLYSFGAENPVGVVNAQLRRRCIGLDFPTAYPIKFFEIAGYEGKKIKFRLISTENTATIITAPKTTDISELLPEEKIKAALQEHLQNIRQQVFDSVLNNSPEFFEHLVVDLLLKMGYQAKEEGYYELFLLELGTGMRRGEILALKWSDLNFKTGELHIERQVYIIKAEVIISEPKTKASIRTVILPPSLLKTLVAYKETVDSEWMFPSPTDNGRPRNPSSVRKRLQLILERAGCKKVRFHDLRHTFATMALEHGMDVKTLSATIGHVSSVTTLDIYSHITDTMQRQAAVHIDRKIGGTDAQMPTIAREERKDTSPVEFTPYKPKIRKPGTGCVTMINDHLYEGRYTPTNAYGKRESHNIYAKTREECEEKLAEMIAEVKAQIKAEKEKMTG